MLKTTAVCILIYMSITTINYSTWDLKYRGVDAGTRASDVNMEIRKIHPLNNKDMRLISFKLDASVLDLMGIKSHCYADMFTFHTNTSSVSIYYSVFMIQSIFRMVSVIKLPG